MEDDTCGCRTIIACCALLLYVVAISINLAFYYTVYVDCSWCQCIKMDRPRRSRFRLLLFYDLRPEINCILFIITRFIQKIDAGLETLFKSFYSLFLFDKNVREFC